MEYKNYLLYTIAITFLFCFFTINIYAQSNACAGAVSLNPSATCVNTAYSITNAFTRDAVVAATCVTDANNRADGWFSFVATNTTSTITVTANRNVAFAVYQGGCGGLTEVGCRNAENNNTQEVLAVTTVIGTTYLIRVIRFDAGGNNTMSGNICVVSPPPPLANDECTGAIDLPVGQFECAFGEITNEGGTYSDTFGGAPSCASGVGAADVWYKFVAPAGGQVVIDTEAGTITDSGMELYHAPDGTCGYLSTGIKTNSLSSDIKLMPNPVSNQLSIVSSQALVVELYNSLGKKVISSDRKLIDVSDLVSGVYIAKIFDSKMEFIKTEKIIKQ